MNKLFIVLILSFLTFIESVKSQENISINGVIHADTAQYSSLLFIDYWIVNNDTATFSNPINIKMGVASTDDETNLITLLLGTVNQSIEAKDSIPFTSILSITPQLFQASDDNLIVIWPSSLAPIETDSSFTIIYINDNLSSIDELNNIKNPSNVGLFDLLGRKYPSYSNIPIGAMYIRDGKKFMKINR
jgi:hypothetical protein